MESYFAYLERLELLGFFSGYALVFTICVWITGRPSERDPFKKRLIESLPYAYALTGSCYIGMILINAWPEVDGKLITTLQEPWLRIWAMLALLFWLPPFSRNPVLSLLHSLVFFYFLVRDLLFYSVGRMDKDFIGNDMKAYGDSLLIIVAALVFIFTLFTLKSKFREARGEGKGV